MDWAQILVILLSLFLAIFLITGIVLLVMLIRVTMQIRTMATSAQPTIASIEKALKGVTKIAALRSVIKAISKQVAAVSLRKGKK